MKRFIHIPIDRDHDEIMRMEWRDMYAYLGPIYMDAITRELLSRTVGIGRVVDCPFEGGFIRRFMSQHTDQELFHMIYNSDAEILLKIDRRRVSKFWMYSRGKISRLVLEKFVNKLKANHTYQLNELLTEAKTKYNNAMGIVAKSRNLDVEPDHMLMILVHDA